MADEKQYFEPRVEIDGLALRVLRYELVERLDEPSSVLLELVLGDAPPPLPADVLDKKLKLSLVGVDGTEERFFAGFVFEARRKADLGDETFLEVRARSALAYLDKRADCRIFQRMTVADIVKEVVSASGIATITWSAVAGTTARDYVVQYRETDAAFVRRLCSEEGVYYVLRSTADGEEEVIFHDAQDGVAALGGDPFVFRAGFGSEATGRHVHRLERTCEVTPDKTFSRDYNFEKPQLSVEGAAESTDPGGHELEAYEWPSRAIDEGGAKTRAAVLSEELQGRRDVVEGEVGSVLLLPGVRTAIEGHPWDAANGEVTIFETRITGVVPRLFERRRAGAPTDDRVFVSSFRGVPTAVAKLRPARVERRALVPGAQTALTTGAGGEEIHVDQHGQVKVSFYWDRSGVDDDHSSRWIRTSQVPLGGSMLLPRVGWETNLRYLDGDVDRPLVMGRMYNAETPPPYALPSEASKSAVQTATTPGGGTSNELRMNDTAGKEEVFFNASKDMTVEVLNNATEVVNHDKKKKVGGNQTKDVTDSQSETIGANQTLSVAGDQTVNVETFMVEDVGGDHALDIGGDRDLKIGGDHKRDVGGDASLDVGASMIDLVVGSIADKAVGDYTHDVGAALVQLCLGKRTFTIGGDHSESTGAVKIVTVNGALGTEVGGSLNSKVAGAVVNMADGSRSEKAGGNFTEVAAGAHIIKATNVTYEGTSMVAVVMGASTIVLLPAMVAVAGISIKLDGDVSDVGIVIDN